MLMRVRVCRGVCGVWGLFGVWVRVVCGGCVDVWCVGVCGVCVCGECVW